MKKYYVTLAFINIIFFTQNIYCCPCNVSTTDKRPFFEQYESTHDTTDEKETAENTNDIAEMVQS